MVVTAGKFFWYFLFLFLTLLYYSFYGILTVVISPSVQARIFPPGCPSPEWVTGSCYGRQCPSLR